MKSTSLFLLILFCLLLGTPVQANPWLLPSDKISVSARYDYAYANQEYLANTGELTPFSLNGEYFSNAYTLGTRIGVRKGFEIEINLPFKVVTYESDPVILSEPNSSISSSFDFYQENIINFNQSKMGLGDLQIATRFQLSLSPIASSLELGFTAPTGYSSPSGTFGNKPTSVEQFVEEAGELARPENIQDDVTLGDGVFAFTPMLHLGYGSSFGFFVRWSEGVRIRNQDAGDLLISEFKMGQFLKPWLLIYGGVYHEYTLTKGRPIGVSVTAIDASLEATQYQGISNLKPILVTLARDQLLFLVGVLFKICKTVGLNCAYTSVFWGRNVARSHVLSMSVNVLSD